MWLIDKLINFGSWTVGIGALLWLVVVVPFLSLYQGGVQPFYTPGIGNQDIANYYMAGVMIMEGEADAIYPIPREGLEGNVGWKESSEMKPAYARIGMERGVEDSHRYNLPPPTALLFVPLALFDYGVVQWIWMILLGLSCWGLCFFGYRQARICGISRPVGIFWLAFWAFSPLFIKGIRTGNATPLAALALAWAAKNVFYNRSARSVAGTVVSVLIKGTGLVLVPLILILRRWRTVLYGALASCVIVVLAGMAMGWSVFAEYFEVVYPTTRMVDSYFANQSVLGFSDRTLGGVFSDAQLKTVGGVFQVAMFLGAIVLVWRRRKTIISDYQAFMASVVLLVGLYLVFSPYCWEHYVVHYIPFWWILWMAAFKGEKIVLLFGTMLLWLPFCTLRGGELVSGEPLESHMLFGQIMLLWIAARILGRSGQESEEDWVWGEDAAGAAR